MYARRGDWATAWVGCVHVGRDGVTRFAQLQDSYIDTESLFDSSRSGLRLFRICGR